MPLKIRLICVIISLLLLVIPYQEGKGADQQGILTVSVDGSLISVHAENVPLRQILSELSENLTANVFFAPSISEVPVNASFDNLPLEKALTRLLSDFNFLAKLKNTNDASILVSLKIYPKRTYSGNLIQIDKTKKVVEVGKGPPNSQGEDREFDKKAAQMDGSRKQPDLSENPVAADSPRETDFVRSEDDVPPVAQEYSSYTTE